MDVCHKKKTKNFVHLFCPSVISAMTRTRSIVSRLRVPVCSERILST